MRIVIDIDDKGSGVKEVLLRLLAKQDCSVLGSAYQYAKALSKMGVDISKVQDNAESNYEMVRDAYARGYCDGVNAILNKPYNAPYNGGRE